jgi:phytanoyl-CoA hydroxylase
MVSTQFQKVSGTQSDQVDQYFRDGYCVAAGLIPRIEVDHIRETFMTQAKDGPVDGLSEMRHHGSEAYDINDPLRFYPRMMHPHKHPNKSVGPLARKYLLDERIGAILRELLREEPVAAQSMFYFKPPGARGQALHQDNFYLRVKPGTCVAAWIAIDDADEHNGGMVCVPGTGDMEVACPEKADPTRFFTTEHVEPPVGKTPRLIPLSAGDVLFFNGSVIHGSYPNTSTDRFRRSLILHYVPMSCVELSGGYRPLLTFDGNEVAKEAATGGGPCGTLQEAAGVH